MYMYLVCEKKTITNSIQVYGKSILIPNFACVCCILFKCQFPSSGKTKSKQVRGAHTLNSETSFVIGGALL